MDLRFGHIELFVRDARASATFYTDILGVELEADQGEFIWVKSGAMSILLRPGGEGEDAGRYNRAAAGLVIYASDLPGTMRELQERGLVFRGDDGPDCPTFTDPDGHWFQLADPTS